MVGLVFDEGLNVFVILFSALGMHEDVCKFFGLAGELDVVLSHLFE